MAAPSGITWGSTVGSYGRIGIYVDTTETSAQVKLHVEVWFWSKYSVSDSSNTYYYDNLASSGSATTSRGSKNIKTTVASGEGWSTSNQVKLAEADYTYNKGTSASTRYLYAKLANIDRVGGTMSTSKTVSIPALAKYTVSYNANGGSGAPNAQTKYYGKTLTLSTTKPKRDGYAFVGWGTSTSDTSKDYSPGGSYTTNAGDTLYAIWSKTIKLTYNANGGSGAPAEQKVTVYNATTSNAFKIPTTVPVKNGFNFKGWAKTASATSAAYQPGGSYSISSDATLYAVWETAYIKPKISSMSVARYAYTENESGDLVGAISDTGTYAQVKCAWSTFVEATEIKIEWKSATGTINGEKIIDVSGKTGNLDTIIGDGDLSTESSFLITITVTDTGGYNSVGKTLSGIKFAIDFLKGGKGGSVGKPAELEGVFDFGWQPKFSTGILWPTLEYGSNIDELFTPNTYIGRNTSSGEYLGTLPNAKNENWPIAGTFTLDIFPSGPDGQTTQIWKICNKTNANVYERVYYGGSWGDWERVVTQARLKKIFETVYGLTTTVTPNGNWTKASGSASLLGTNLRCNYSATRGSGSSAGNITNEDTCTFKIKHDGKVKTIYSVSFISGGTGPLATFTISNQVIDDEYITFTITMSATESAVTESSGYFSIPVVLNVDAY